ncbi:MAG: hypothetical protein JWQ25_567 [Daejeonella sp.]|nr:hypothetical protein [Daejeonella sp.]
MSQVADQLNTVIDKTTRLIDLCAALQEENDLLKLENQNVKSALNLSKERCNELEEKVKVVQLARSLEGMPVINADSSEKTFDIKQKISEFVREIDKCIVLLKK